MAGEVYQKILVETFESIKIQEVNMFFLNIPYNKKDRASLYCTVYSVQ